MTNLTTSGALPSRFYNICGECWTQASLAISSYNKNADATNPKPLRIVTIGVACEPIPIPAPVAEHEIPGAFPGEPMLICEPETIRFSVQIELIPPPPEKTMPGAFPDEYALPSIECVFLYARPVNDELTSEIVKLIAAYQKWKPECDSAGEKAEYEGFFAQGDSVLKDMVRDHNFGCEKCSAIH